MVYERPNSAAAGKVKTIALDNSTYLRSKVQGLDSPRETVLPSIESPQVAPPLPPGLMVSFHPPPLPLSDDRPGMTTNKDLERHVHNLEFLDLTEERQSLKKRRRIEDTVPEISKLARTGTVAQMLPSQRREPEYIPLVSPTDQYSQPSNSHSSTSYYQDFYDYSKGSSATTPYRDIKEYSSPVTFTHAENRPVHHRPAAHVSSMSHLRAREDFYQKTSSPRINESMPSRLRSALPGSTTPVDRGIQEYRAFRARERQDRALCSPSGRVRLSHEKPDLSDMVIESRNGQPRHVDAVVPSRGPSYHLPSPRLSQDSFAIADVSRLTRVADYRPKYGRRLEHVYPVQRRSASPVENASNGGSHVPTWSQPQRQHGRGLDYISLDGDPLAQRSEHLNPRLVRPPQR